MDRIGKILNIPSVRVIAELNQIFISQSNEEFIGEDNLLFRGALEYILEAIKHQPFGANIYPTIFHKAAAIAERIIVNHVFYGANKRTGLATCVIFLRMNDYEMQIFDQERFEQNAVNTALDLQQKQISLEEFTEWVKARCTPLLTDTES